MGGKKMAAMNELEHRNSEISKCIQELILFLNKQ
jgi:hypothetical protein